MYTGGTSCFFFVSLPPECKDIIYGRRKEEAEKEESGGRGRQRTQETVAGDVRHAGGDQGDACRQGTAALQRGAGTDGDTPAVAGTDHRRERAGAANHLRRRRRRDGRLQRR